MVCDSLTEMEQDALTLVRRGRCCSRAELSRKMGISRPTASLLVERLLELRCLRESGRGKAPRGKSPTLLTPVPEYQYTLGLDLGYTERLAGVLVDGEYRIVRRAEAKFDNSSLESIRSRSASLLEKLAGKSEITGLGIALPGILDPRTNRVLRSIVPLFARYDMQALFTEWTGLPAVVENRSRSAAFSEAFGGAADSQNNFVLVSLGKSIGAAFWLNGSVFTGSFGAAGEIRSLRLGDGRTLEEALSLACVQNYSEEELVSICAEGLHQLTELMDLDRLVLAGRFTDFGPIFRKKLTAKLNVYRKCRIVFSGYGRFSAARGAAMSMCEKALAAR